MDDGAKPINSVSKMFSYSQSWGGRGGINSLTKIFIYMSRALHQIYLSLDYKYDIEIEQYFLQDEEFKDSLVKELYKLLLTEKGNDIMRIKHYWYSISEQLEDAIQSDEFERADILKRLKEIIFKDWATVLILS